MTGKDAPTAELMAMTTAWKELSARWELTWRESWVLFPEGGEDAEFPPADTETRMRLLIEVGYRLNLGEPISLQDWLREPSAAFGGYTPLEAMSESLTGLRRARQLVELGLLP